MLNITCQLPETVLATLHMTTAEMAHEIRTAASIQWYAQGSISQSRAAEIAGLDRVSVLRELARRNVSAIQTTESELADELDLIRAAGR